ncbi:DEN2D protein, partial [Polypterus senegalus]
MKTGVMPSEGEAPVTSTRTRISNLFASFAKKSPNEEDNSQNTGKADDVPSRTSMLLNPIKVLKERSSKERQPQNLEAKNQEMEQRESRYASGQFFFEYLVVVSLKKTKTNSYEPQVIYQFPKKDGMIRYQKEEEEKTLKAIMLFCFPEGVSWAPLTEYKRCAVYWHPLLIKRGPGSHASLYYIDTGLAHLYRRSFITGGSSPNRRRRPSPSPTALWLRSQIPNDLFNGRQDLQDTRYGLD